MRQLKTMLRARKAQMLWCGPCECLTLKCWRENDEYCNCGESKTSLPNKFKVRENSEDLFLTSFFNEDVEQDNTISIESDPYSETWDFFLRVWNFLIIEDEDTRVLWRETRESLDAEAVEKLLGRYDEGNTWVWHFTPEAMAQFNALINNPTEEQADSLREWLEDKASDEYDPPHYPIVIFDLPPLNNVIDAYGGNSADVLTDGGENYIGVSIETDTEMWHEKVVVGPSWAFDNERYIIEGVNVWIDLFESVMGVDKVKSMMENVTSFPDEIFAAMNTYYNNPTLSNANSLKNLLSNWDPS